MFVADPDLIPGSMESPGVLPEHRGVPKALWRPKPFPQKDTFLASLFSTHILFLVPGIAAIYFLLLQLRSFVCNGENVYYPGTYRPHLTIPKYPSRTHIISHNYMLDLERWYSEEGACLVCNQPRFNPQHHLMVPKSCQE